MKTTPNDLMLAARQKFLSDNRDLIALIKNLSVDELTRKMAAAMELNPEFTEEIMLHADSSYLNQLGPAGRAARESFSRAAYKAICQSYLKISRNGCTLLNCRLADFSEANAQLEAIEVAAGEKEAAPLPPPPKSQTELLVEQVREDWKKFPTDKMRKKINSDREYKKVFDQLMAAGLLESNCTSLVDGSRGFQR